MTRFEIIGRVVRDSKPDHITVKNVKTAVINFTLAVSHYTRDGADFFNISAYGKVAENLSKFAKKGTKLFVFGYLSTTNYRKHTEIGLVAEGFEFIESMDKFCNTGAIADVIMPEKTTDDMPFS